MLVDFGISWVILGHSERRLLLGESNEVRSIDNACNLNILAWILDNLAIILLSVIQKLLPRIFTFSSLINKTWQSVLKLYLLNGFKIYLFLNLVLKLGAQFWNSSFWMEIFLLEFTSETRNSVLKLYLLNGIKTYPFLNLAPKHGTQFWNSSFSQNKFSKAQVTPNFLNLLSQ